MQRSPSHRELEKIRGTGRSGHPARLPRGAAEFAALPGFRITDRVEIIRASADASRAGRDGHAAVELAGAGGKPVYNFRSDGRTHRPRRSGA